jgi:hypothetical protein
MEWKPPFSTIGGKAAALCNLRVEIMQFRNYRFSPCFIFLFSVSALAAGGAVEQLVGKRLKELYGGTPVTTEESYQIVNRARISPEAVVILDSSDVYEFQNLNKKVRAQAPTADWRADLKDFPNLAKAISDHLSNKGVPADVPWVRVTELLRVRTKPLTVMLSLYGRQTPKRPDAKNVSYLKDVTALTVIASQKNKTWQLNVLGGTYNELTDVEKGPDAYRGWDLADVDGDGKKELIVEANGYESHELRVYTERGNGFELIYSGGGYGL